MRFYDHYYIDSTKAQVGFTKELGHRLRHISADIDEKFFRGEQTTNFWIAAKNTAAWLVSFGSIVKKYPQLSAKKNEVVKIFKFLHKNVHHIATFISEVRLSFTRSATVNFANCQDNNYVTHAAEASPIFLWCVRVREQSSNNDKDHASSTWVILRPGVSFSVAEMDHKQSTCLWSRDSGPKFLQSADVYQYLQLNLKPYLFLLSGRIRQVWIFPVSGRTRKNPELCDVKNVVWESIPNLRTFYAQSMHRHRLYKVYTLLYFPRCPSSKVSLCSQLLCGLGYWFLVQN